MSFEDWEKEIRLTIESFPDPYKEEILILFDDWIRTNPQPPLYSDWAVFSSKFDDQESLYTERRVYFKRIKNELRDREIPLKQWQKVAKALAAIASIFLVIFLAISRVFRAAE